MLSNEEPCESSDESYSEEDQEMELIPYATNNDDERKIKQKQWRNFKEWNSPPIIIKLTKRY